MRAQFPRRADFRLPGFCMRLRCPIRLTATEGDVNFLSLHRKWIKIDFGSHLLHPEFRDERLHRMSAFLPL